MLLVEAIVGKRSDDVPEAPPAPARSHGLGGEPADMMCF